MRLIYRYILKTKQKKIAKLGSSSSEVEMITGIGGRGKGDRYATLWREKINCVVWKDTKRLKMGGGGGRTREEGRGLLE